MTPLLRIAAAVSAYLAVAVITALLVRRAGRDLADFTSRTSPVVVALGAVANLVTMGIVFALFVLVDRRPLSQLGFGLAPRDAAFAATAAAVTFALAFAFVRWLEHGGRVQRAPANAAPEAPGERSAFLMTALVLCIVVLQEEVLYRGYVLANLGQASVPVQLVASTAIFVAIHFATNRGDVAQVVSWTVGGLVLAAAYLASGSLWVSSALHLASNLVNVVVFGIVGRFSFVRFAKAPTGRDRAIFRVGYGLAMAAVLLVFYGT